MLFWPVFLGLVLAFHSSLLLSLVMSYGVEPSSRKTRDLQSQSLPGANPDTIIVGASCGYESIAIQGSHDFPTEDARILLLMNKQTKL